MKVLVTGANGLLGRDLCPILKKEGCEVIKTDIEGEGLDFVLDILDKKTVEEIFLKEKPDVIIHCAAYTNADKAQEEFEKAEKINVEGTKNVALASKKIGAIMVYISTDYVFDGEKGAPYLPNDLPKPINNYGKTKFLGEEIVRRNLEKYYILRTSWLYGAYGRNFVETMISLAKNNEKIKVVDDQIGSPTWTLDLSNGIIKILKEKEFKGKYGVYHLSGGGKTSWHGFAEKIFEKMNLKVDLKPCATKDFPRLAKRPKYSVLENNGLLRDWELALDDYIKAREA